ncbi:related to arsenic resistance protein ArsH [Ustilago trichophora]|uniref:Related to arsenic resistance protein ArsH n=1 Tax=Ustilago trichophora TaxID=86804 RepID=A0A5C3E1W5_9BASI|nr:related to arsenic resistance protein ArsH [Ustilago trichophora]
MTASQRLESVCSEESSRYRPFLDASFYPSGSNITDDWTYQIASGSGLDQLSEARMMHETLSEPLRVLVLYGSNRQRSFSKLMAYEASRLLHHLGCHVRVFNPQGLPLKDDCDHPDICADSGGTESHPKVIELRNLVTWSEAHFWCSPEQHGNMTGIMKTIIDHIPLSLGSVRPTQGKILAVSQVNGGSQSFNAVNSLRILGRWMRMFTIPNQASLPKAWTQFTEQEGRMKESSNRERLVDVVEELVKVGCLFRGREELMASRWSERKERGEMGRLLSQEEKEKRKKEEEMKAKQAEDKVTPDVL